MKGAVCGRAGDKARPTKQAKSEAETKPAGEAIREQLALPPIGVQLNELDKARACPTRPRVRPTSPRAS